MSVRTRIATIRLLEKMEQNSAYSKKLGLSNASLRKRESSKRDYKRDQMM